MSKNAKKVLIIAVAGLVLFYIIVEPGNAAGVVHTILGALEDAAESLLTFMSELFNG